MKIKGILMLTLALVTTACYGQDTKTFKARNRVDFAYEVILPEGYEKGKSYELAVVFSEINVDEKGYQPTLSAVKQVKGIKNTIFFIPKVPAGKPHWISHPIHHGLNDFMKSMRSTYGKPNQKFHFVGHLKGGRVAQTYSGMSSEYVASVSFAHSTHWTITKQEYFEGIFNLGFKVYVYSNQPADKLALDVSKAAYGKTSDFGKTITMIDSKIRSY